MIRTDSLLTPLLKSLGIEEGVRLARLRNNWKDIFDEPLSLHMSPARLSEGELVISVDSPIWMQQLGYFKREIASKLKIFGVKDIRFRLGRVSKMRRQAPEAQNKSKLTSEEHLFISEVVSTIDDEELKRAIQKAIEKNLASGKSC